LSDFVPVDAVDACTDWTVRERPFHLHHTYTAFTDAAGGTGSDSFTLAVAHKEGDKIILDVLRERKPRFVPANVVAEFCELLRSYRIAEVTGDRFSGGWCASEFKRHDIKYKASEKSKSELYLAALPLMLSGRAVLLDDATLRRQFSELERHNSVSPY
jgi:hypothetical protein